MKHLYRYLTLLALLGGAAAPRAAHAQSKLRLDSNNPGPDWTLVARDEFNDSAHTGKPDPRIWNNSMVKYNNPLYGWSSEMYDGSMVTVSDGKAHLRVTRLRTAQGDTTHLVDPDTNRKHRTIRYVAGMLSSVEGNKFSLGDFGAYEARLRLPYDPTTDASPAFWLFNGVTEIDMMDGVRPDNSIQNPGLLTNVLEWRNVVDKNGGSEFKVVNDCGRRSKIWSGTSPVATQLSGKYCTYTMVWTPEKVTFFIDGREVRTVTRAAVATFHQNNLDLILAISANWWSTTTTDFTLDVDYVRLLRPTYVLAHPTESSTYVAPSTTYKSDYEVVPHDISQPNANIDRDAAGNVTYRDLNGPTASAKMSDVAGSLALNPDNEHQVFYRGLDDQLYLATESYPNGWTVAALPAVAGLTVAGDVRYNAFTHSVLFKGSDGQLHAYTAPTSPGGLWQPSQLTTGTDANALVSQQPGSVACRARDGFIAYIGRDNNIRYFTPNAAVGTLYTWDGSNAYAGGDVQLDDVNILYRGQDSRLQVYYVANNQYYHNWIDNALPQAVPLSGKPGSLALSTTTDYYVGTDDHVHAMTYNPATGRIDYADLPAPGSWFEEVQGSLAATADDTHVFYRGKDGRIQTLYRDGSGWHHTWDDDYFTTGEFTSFTGNDPAARSASLVTSNGRQFYCDAYHHLRYLAWELAELSDCTTNHNEIIGTLHRTGTPPTAPAAPAPAAAAAEVLDFGVAPNPTAGQLTVGLPTALRALSLPYTLTSALGAVVQQGSLTAGHLTLELGSLPSGLYVLTTQAPGHVYHTRVVKE